MAFQRHRSRVDSQCGEILSQMFKLVFNEASTFFSVRLTIASS
jgi:hypothetical protein